MQSAVILRCDQVGFGQQKTIRNGRLFDCLGILIECVLCGYPVNRDDYAIQSIAVCQRGFCHQCMDDRRRICQSRGFDQHPPELTFAITCKTPCHVSQRLDQVPSDCTAQASAAHLCNDVFRALRYQQVIEPDFTKLVNDHQGVSQFGLTNQMIQHGCLAAAQETSHYRYRN